MHLNKEHDLINFNKSKNEPVSLRIPDDVLREVDKICTHFRLSRTNLIVMFILNGLHSTKVNFTEYGINIGEVDNEGS